MKRRESWSDRWPGTPKKIEKNQGKAIDTQGVRDEMVVDGQEAQKMENVTGEKGGQGLMTRSTIGTSAIIEIDIHPNLRYCERVRDMGQKMR